MPEIRTEICLLAKELWVNCSNDDVRNYEYNNIHNNLLLTYRPSGM